MSCELSLGSPSSFRQVLLSVKSLTHACLSEFLRWKLKQLFHIWHGMTQTTQEEAESQRGRGDSESNVRLVHPREM